MNNYKIRVENRAESRAAQELFFELGFSWIGEKAGEFWETTTSWIYAKDHNKALYGGSVGTDTVYKQITLPELRDIVVLKRNSIEDATHTDQDNWKWYIGADSYVWQAGNAQQLKQWDKSSLDHVELKPIEKKMKEYLVKNKHDEYVLLNDVSCIPSEFVIEVPEGANIYAKCNIFGDYKFLPYEVDGDWGVVWQRHTQPEELPFIDDEPTLDKIKIKVDGDLNKAIDIAKCEGYYNCQFDKIPDGAYWLLCNEDGTVDYSMNENIINEYAFLHTDRSLNNQYAEIEKVRQSTNETEYLMQGANGDHLKESIKELKSGNVVYLPHSSISKSTELPEFEFNTPTVTSAWDKQEGGSHYKNLAIQPMQYALANKLDYAQANVVKYVTRHADKNGKEDLLKAIHNIELMIEHYYG